jgi:hypothetical protein
MSLNEAKNSLAIKESEGATVVNINLDKEVHFTFGLLGPDLDTIRMFDPSFTQVIYNAGNTAVTDEYIADLGRVNGLRHFPVDESATVTVVPAAVLAASAVTGALTLTVNNARKFAASDTIAVVRGGTSENHTIASVNAATNVITLTSGMINAFPTGAMVKNTKAGNELDEGTDYILFPRLGQISRPTESASTLDGDGASISYSYHSAQGSGFGSGSFTEAATYKLEFWTMKRGGGCRVIRMFKASVSGDFTTFLINQDSESPIPIDVSLVADETIADTHRNIYEMIDYADKSVAPGNGW